MPHWQERCPSQPCHLTFTLLRSSMVARTLTWGQWDWLLFELPVHILSTKKWEITTPPLGWWLGVKTAGKKGKDGMWSWGSGDTAQGRSTDILREHLDGGGDYAKQKYPPGGKQANSFFKKKSFLQLALNVKENIPADIDKWGQTKSEGSDFEGISCL